MREDELLVTHHVGDVINILQRTTHHLFDPDELLTVRQNLPLFYFSVIWIYECEIIQGKSEEKKHYQSLLLHYNILRASNQD